MLIKGDISVYVDNIIIISVLIFNGIYIIMVLMGFSSLLKMQRWTFTLLVKQSPVFLSYFDHSILKFQIFPDPIFGILFNFHYNSCVCVCVHMCARECVRMCAHVRARARANTHTLTHCVRVSWTCFPRYVVCVLRPYASLWCTLPHILLSGFLQHLLILNSGALVVSLLKAMGHWVKDGFH